MLFVIPNNSLLYKCQFESSSHTTAFHSKCFKSKMQIYSHHVRPLRNPNPNRNSAHSRRRNRASGGVQGDVRDRNRVQEDGTAAVSNFPGKNLVMEQVKILKRGEDLKPAANGRRLGDEDSVLSSTVRLGPEPETVQKQIRVSDLKVVADYAGSAAVLSSPPPSSLPIPAFFSRK